MERGGVRDAGSAQAGAEQLGGRTYHFFSCQVFSWFSCTANMLGRATAPVMLSPQQDLQGSANNCFLDS